MVTQHSSFAFRSSIFTLLIALSIGCGGEMIDPAPAAMQLASESGRYLIEVSSDPNPTARGVNTVMFTVTDDGGAPMPQLALDVQPWMPSHNHGTSVQPTVVNMNGGTYRIDNVYFFMAGHWELRTTFTESGDHVVPVFDVP
jgi:hypothetical protein